MKILVDADGTSRIRQVEDIAKRFRSRLKIPKKRNVISPRT